MKAVVFHGVHDIRVEDIPVPEVEPGSLLIKVKACGICGTDLHIYKHGGREGIIFGHEFAGEVVKIGAGVAGIKGGDTITGIGYRPCRQCYWCQQMQFNRCPKPALMGNQLPGAMAEYVVIPSAQLGRTIFHIPAPLTYDDGASVEPLAIAVRAVKKARPQPQDTVVVLGTGIIGLFTIQVLKAMGVAKIIATGHRTKRLEAAESSGADLIINATKEDPIPLVREATSQMLADIAIECAGSPETFKQAIEMVHSGGSIVLVGMFERPFNWNPTVVVDKSLTLIGSIAGHFPGAIELLQAGKANAKLLITHELPLDRAKDAFEMQLNSQDAVKVMLKP